LLPNNSAVKIPNGRDSEETLLNFKEFCFPVFIEQALVEKLSNRIQISLDGIATKLNFCDVDDHLLSDSEDQGSDYLYDSSSESFSKSRPTAYEYKEDEIEGTRVRVGLYVVTIEGGLSVATLMTWPSFLSREPMPHMIQSLYQYYPLVRHLTETLHAVCEIDRRNTKKRTIQDTGDVWSRGTLHDDDVKSPDKPYNFFAFDEITEMQNTHIGISNVEASNNFSSTINWAHDLFSEHPDATKVVLRNHAGSVLCRKYFGKETFFQTTTEKFEDVELVASRHLGSDHAAGFI